MFLHVRLISSVGLMALSPPFDAARIRAGSTLLSCSLLSQELVVANDKHNLPEQGYGFGVQVRMAPGEAVSLESVEPERQAGPSR